MPDRSVKSIVRSVLLAAALVISACALGIHLRIAPVPVVCAGLCAASLAGFRLLERKPVSRREGVTLALFSLVIGVVLILGLHIDVDAMDLYGGTIHKNRITPYSWQDVWILLLMLPSLTTLLCAAYRLIADAKLDAACFDPAPHIRRQLALFALLFVLWLPYLLAYWPGIILSDTLSSVRQALGITRLNNRHPFCYTIFLRLCFMAGDALFHSTTAGYALYTVIQMLYMSFCLAYLLNWVWRNGRFGRGVAMLFTALFGLLPYFAAFSAAGWKDPVFSVSVAALSVYLLDEALHNRQKPPFRSLLFYAMLLLVTVFARHNGIGILAAVGAWKLVRLIWRREKWRTAVLTAGVICLYFLITGPVYDYLDIRSDKREANALFVQQMARVGALNGEMSESEAAYLDSMLPLELYESTYRPCCVDMLKWDGSFNSDALADGLYENWFSLMLKNPRLYFEGWELNTLGFWTLNLPDINSKASNLHGGIIQNLSPDKVQGIRDELGIEMTNLLGHDDLRRIFPTDSWFIPIGWMMWLMVFLVICMCLKGQTRLLCGMLPALGLALPLVIGTPISYWMRYIVALHYMLPAWLLLFRLKKEKTC